jgi:hypothetical protein
MYSKVEDVFDRSIVVASLNWGLGHVYRSCGLIRQLISQNNTIIIACSASQSSHFQYVLNGLPIQYVPIDDYSFTFTGKGNWMFDTIRSYPKLRKELKMDRKHVDQIIEKFNIDLLISDHRYGFYSSKIPSIFLTHQIHLPVPWYAKFVQKFHQNHLNTFTNVWILDNDKNELAGKLSVKNANNQSYIGWYSAYFDISVDQDSSTLIIVSGPDPYNKLFLESSKELYKNHDEVYLICSLENIVIPQNWKIVPQSFLERNERFNKASVIVTRSGYTSIMDGKLLHKTMKMTATIGQKEQIYLCELHQK